MDLTRPGTSHAGLQLRNDLRQAFENWIGDQVSGPWDIVIEAVAESVEDGGLSSSTAARIDLALQRTDGTEADVCYVCYCTYPGGAHAH
jgi:hypothetical protein